MNKNQLSEVAIEYALHINQIQKARDIFERDCNSFMNDLRDYLDKKFAMLKERKLYFNTTDSLKISRSGHAKNYYSICKYPIEVKTGKAKSARYETLGAFQTGIEFDTSCQAFVWSTKFHNEEDILDPQLDEKMLSKIKKYTKEDQKALFNSFEQIRFDGLYFQKMLIDAECNLDFKAPIDASINILISTMVESENFINRLGKAERNKVMKVVS